MNQDDLLIFEAYIRPTAAERRVAVKKSRHEMTPPPKRDPNKSQTYNKIIHLNYEFDKDLKADSHYKDISGKLNQEKYESISYITNTTIDQVKAAIEKGTDPAPAAYRPVSDPLQRTNTLSSEE